jgi:hypothetical protein
MNEQVLLKPPEQVYQTNSSEITNLEDELGFQQEKLKKKDQIKIFTFKLQCNANLLKLLLAI